MVLTSHTLTSDILKEIIRASMIEICLCYAPEDDELRQALEKHLRVMERQKLLVALWSSHDIRAGEERKFEIKKRLDTAHVILLLLSADFLASDNFYYHEVIPAIQRRESREARVIPILLRAVHWHDTPLGSLQALPENGKPVTDRSWHNLDEALFIVADGIRKVVEDLTSVSSTNPITTSVRRANPEKPHLALKRNDANFVAVQTLVDHLGPVASVLFTSDGNTLVSDSWDHTIKYWDLHAHVRRTLTGHPGPIYSLAYNYDANTRYHRLSSGGDDPSIRLWNFDTGTLMESLTGHSGPISSVAFSPDGKMLASGSDDCTLRIWNLVTGLPGAILRGHSGPISSVAFSPDGKMLASASYDMTIRCWNTDGETLFILMGHSEPISSIVISPDGATLASGSYDNTIKLWNLQTMQMIRTLVSHSGPVSSVAFSPDGTTLISGGYDKTIKVWNYFTGQLTSTCEGHSAAILCVAFHPQGHLFVSGSLDKTIKIWKQQELDVHPRNPYKGLRAFAPDDVHDFFGRTVLIDKLVHSVETILTLDKQEKQHTRLLAVVGPSGSGKSSVIMAGLLPWLQAGEVFDSNMWIYLNPLVPGEHPTEALALALVERFPEKNLQMLCDDLQNDTAINLHLYAAGLAKRVESTSPYVVLIVDQFEELFTLTTTEQERQQFINLLVTACTQQGGPLIVLLALRADFYDRISHYPDLYTLIKKHQVAMPPMTLDERRAVITQPATLPDVQLTFEENLVEDLLFDVQGQIGALPLLQFTLDKLYQLRAGFLLTLSAYHEMGGIQGTLASLAENAYQSLPSEAHRFLAYVLFLRLIGLDVTGQNVTWRRAALNEFVFADLRQTRLMQEVIEHFVQVRLLTVAARGTEVTIEVSHEALFQEWLRLDEWIKEHHNDISLQQRLHRDAVEWLFHSRSTDRLYRGTVLTEALAWSKRNTPSAHESAFLNASARRSIGTRIIRWLKRNP